MGEPRLGYAREAVGRLLFVGIGTTSLLILFALMMEVIVSS
jgi:hypothetical protein